MNRRHFLSLSQGTMLAAGLLAGGLSSRMLGSGTAAAAGGSSESQVMKIADLALGVKLETLPGDVVSAAKRVLLDTLGCAFGAVGSEPAAIAESTIRL